MPLDQDLTFKVISDNDASVKVKIYVGIPMRNSGLSVWLCVSWWRQM